MPSIRLRLGSKCTAHQEFWRSEVKPSNQREFLWCTMRVMLFCEICLISSLHYVICTLDSGITAMQAAFITSFRFGIAEVHYLYLKSALEQPCFTLIPWLSVDTAMTELYYHVCFVMFVLVGFGKKPSTCAIFSSNFIKQNW